MTPAHPRRRAAPLRLVSRRRDDQRARRWPPWPGSPTRACPAPTRRSWWALREMSATTVRCAPKGRRCASRRRKVESFGQCGLRWLLRRLRRRRALGRARPTSAPSCTTSPPSSATPTRRPCGPRSTPGGAASGLPRAGCRTAKRLEAHAMVGWLARLLRPRRAAGLGAHRRRARHGGRARAGRAQRQGRPDRAARPTARCASSTTRPARQQAAARTTCPATPSSGPTSWRSSGGAFAEHGTASAARRCSRSARAPTSATSRCRSSARCTPTTTRSGPSGSSRRRPRGWRAATFTATVGAWCDVCAVQGHAAPPSPRGRHCDDADGDDATGTLTGARATPPRHRHGAGDADAHRRAARRHRGAARAAARRRRCRLGQDRDHGLHGWCGWSPTVSSSPTRCSA